MAEKLQGQGSQAGYSPKCHKESDMTEQLSTYIIHFSFILCCLEQIKLPSIIKETPTV